MRPDTRNTGTVAELKMKFAGNQNVKNVIGVAGMAIRTPSTVTKVVCRVRSHIGGANTTCGTTKKDMIKESVGELSSSSKNSSRVKDLIKKLNEGSQELPKSNGQTGNNKVANALTNSSKKTATQDVLDVRKKSADAANNRLGGIIVDLDVTDKENKLPQIVDLETMYSLLAEKHSELLRAYNGMQVQQLKDSTLRKDKREIQRLTKTNSDLSSEINKLQAQLKESVEHNELLEFRLLELEDTETTNKLKSQNRETTEDMSDSGVMSLTTSDDYCSEGDQQEYDLDIRRCDNIKQRLMEMCTGVCYCVEDRSTIQQVLGLIRHFECRLTEADHGERHKPPPVYADCLQESGIFEDDVPYPEAAQTELPADKAGNEPLPSTDLTEELRKLSRIREKIEERKVPLVDDRAAKELSFYKDRWQVLEKKVEAYESDGDRKIRLLATSIDRESRLSNELKNVYATVDKLKEQNRLLEEEKCEFEEAENDTRLRCQKLESKYLALVEKKNSLQAELTEKSKETEKLRQELAEVDAKKCEARKHAATMEALVNKYEQRNFELEESQMETKCKLQLLENAWPAIVLWNIWRAVCKHYRKAKPVGAIEHKTSAAESVDVDYLEKLRIMTKEKMDLEKQIQDLQFKENVYQQTLQQADHILANVEDGYKRQIDELNSELAEKQKLLLDRENRMRISADSRDREAELLDRVHGLETEVRDLAHKIKTKDIEKQSWARREAQLRNDMEQLVNDVCQVKSENGQLKTLLDCEKMKLRDLQNDISFKQSVYAELEDKSNLEAKSYQTTILKLSKQIDEFDVTNGELKEEVETLEAHVKHLRNALAEEKEAKESMNIELNRELSRKQEVIDGLERHLSYRGSKNAAEELLCENVNTNVGKLNFDEINLSDSLQSALQYSKLKQLKTCDGCAKNVEPKLQALFNRFDNIMTTVDRTKNTTIGACCSSGNVKDCPKSECPTSSKCSAADRLTVCDLTKQAVVLEAKNEEKDKIIMMLADELLYLAERAKWDRQCVIAQGLNSIPSTRFAPDFNCTTVEKYLNGRHVKSVDDGNIEDNKYRCLIGPDNPIGLHVVRQIGPDGIVLAWKSPAPDTISSFQVFLNGELVQTVQNPGRSTTLLHPVNLQEPITITMNAVKQDGVAFPPIAICHPYGV